MLTGDNSILNRATDAREKNVEGQVREEIAIAWNGVQAEAIPQGVKDNGDKAEKLQAELQNEDSEATAQVSGDDENKIVVTYKGYETTINVSNGSMTALVKVGTITPTGTENPTPESTSVAELREGDRVIYTTKDGEQVPCVVLYDSTGEYGIQLVTANTIGNAIEIGPYLTPSELTGSQKYQLAKEAYNTIVSIFNTEAQKYVNTNLSPDWGARSVGTNPAIRPVTGETDDGTYVSNYTRFQSYDNQFKDGDIRTISSDELNKITDWVQMGKSSINCRNATSNYFLGCRVILDNINNHLSFGFAYVYVGYGSPFVSTNTLVTLGDEEGAWGHYSKLRAVFILKDSATYVTSGDNKILVCE